MKLGIMQPYLFPYIGYFQLIQAVDQYVVYDDVHFIKQGWINRNNILVNGNKHLITLHLGEASSNRLINEVTVKDNREKLLKTIYSSYRRAPNFSEAYPLVESILRFQESNLAGFIHNSLHTLCEYMGINTPLLRSSGIQKDNSLKGQDKVIHICKLLNCRHYINAIGGQDLYSADRFAEQGIRLSFLKSSAIQYRQFDSEFLPNLSIIDVLMFNSKEKVQKLLTAYELVG